MRGLFLGAGASYEVGMPLVWEFSQTLRENVLKRLETNLFDFKGDIKLKSYFIEILSNQKLHYEQVIGLLEERMIKNNDNDQQTHGILIQLIECIQLLLLEDQANTLKLLTEKIKDYYGIISLLNKEKVFNIFSLNHDIVFEEILDYYRIPYKDGFYERKNNYSNVANFKVLTSNEIETGNLDVFHEKENGINLIKLHGSLDIFAVEDKNLFLKVYGEANYVGSNYSEIRKIESRNIEISQRDGLRTTNELYIYDKLGELQFLRRSLLSGAHKFKKKFDQIIPIALLTFFKQQLMKINKLTVVGYSFGDSHINETMKEWLKDKSKIIEVYDPYKKTTPKGFETYATQFIFNNGGLTDYFLTFDSTHESWASKSKRKMLREMRDNLKKRRLSLEK